MTARALETPQQYRLECSISLSGLLAYLDSPNYEDDTVEAREILGSELLLLHELTEICILKSMRY